MAQCVVQSVHGEDGFEALRQLHTQFESKPMVPQEQVLVDFAAMVTRSTKIVNETRSSSWKSIGI